MKKILLPVFVFAFILYGCNKKDVQEKVETKPVQEQPSNNIAQGSPADTITKSSNDGISDIKYNVNEFKSVLKYSGKIDFGVQWKDKNGLNVVILTTSEIKRSKSKTGIEEYSESKNLYGYQFIKSNDKFEELWKVQDFVNDCDADLELKFIENSLSVTDINNNGIGETTFLYTLGCRSDVSPVGLKLLMHEGKDKYALRGETLIKLQNVEPYGGKMDVDKSFNQAPEGFLSYAKKQWNKFVEEKFEN